MTKSRLTFSKVKGKLNHYLIANTEEEIELLKKDMELKGFELVRVTPFLEKIGYEPTQPTKKRHSKRIN